MNKVIFLIILFFSCHYASAKLMQSKSLDAKELQDMLQWVDKDTTIIINIDDVITIPISKMFSLDTNPNKQFIDTLVALSKQQPTFKTAIANWYQQRQIKLVDKNWINYIEKAKLKGANVYGMCSMPIQLVNIEEKRFLELQYLGINFTNIINGQSQLIISNKQKWYSNFYKGIIFIGPYSKSQTILDFIRITNHIPIKMLVIDSVYNDLVKVDKALRIFNMYYYNIYYQGAKNALAKPDPKVVKLQQQQLIQNTKWLEDAAAEALLYPAAK